MTKKTLFSIIVVSYNAADLIRDTIDSILRQTYADYEIIVKDACSDDNTVGQIPDSDKIRIFRSKDSGIYDGMNQAIREARGQFLHFLNCGDKFTSDDVLEKIAARIDKEKITDGILYGDCIMDGAYKKQPSAITSFFLFRTPLCHQSMFFSRSVFTDYGLYDVKYQILADYNCTVCAFRNKVPFYYCNIPVCTYLGGGISESEKGIMIKKQEYKQIRKAYYSRWERFKYELLLILSLRILRNWIVSQRSPKFLRNWYYKAVNRVNR